MSSENKANGLTTENELKNGREFIRICASLKTVSVACHSDADGLTSGLLAARTLERLGVPSVPIIPTGKGENVHQDPMREKIRRIAPQALIVTDMGSRADPIVPGLPTLIIDHHHPHGFPPGAVTVSAFGHEPIVSSSLLAWHLCAPLVSLDDLKWLGLLGVVGDLGTAFPFPDWTPLLKVYGGRHVTEAVALLNAAYRHPLGAHAEKVYRARRKRYVSSEPS